IYAWEVSSGDFSFGFQSDGSDFTPGNITLKIRNNTGDVLTKLNVSYDIYVYNNQDRSTFFNFSYSTDDVTYTDVPALDFTSPEAADLSPSWTSENKTTSITGLSVADGDSVFLRWPSDDAVGAAGSRDEFGLDNVVLSAGAEPLPIQLSSFTGIYISANSVQLNWITITEVNNYGFFVERRRVNQHTFVELPNSFIPGHGTTLIRHSYTYTDNSANGEMWYYRLRQVDLDGTVHHTDGIRVDVLTDVEVEPLPTVYALEQNYPNPFNPSTQIQFALPQESRVRLEVFNIIGERVANLVDETRPVGYYSEQFDATGLASGLYFYRIQALGPSGESFVQSKKLLLLR
ncbi:MAG: T9SS type A sorting domain-containing protein, partial [Ignavibacteria bacterium]|nr:T9SS type A sorting domain-containing protein [Ignavibacteria bacterium]